MPKIAILDHRAPRKIADALQRYGYCPLRMPPHPDLPEPIQAHPDTLLFFAKDAIYTTARYADIAQKQLSQISHICGRPIRICRKELSCGYENEVLFNAVSMGNHRLLCNPKHVAQEILADHHLQILSTKQGYTKCATLPLGDDALITADPSVADTANAEGISVLTLSCHGTLLPGYDTGFFGGAGSYAPYAAVDHVFFCGNLSHHPQAEQIQAFCYAYGYEPISLGEDPLRDLGTVFLV